VAKRIRIMPHTLSAPLTPVPGPSRVVNSLLTYLLIVVLYCHANYDAELKDVKAVKVKAVISS